LSTTEPVTDASISHMDLRKTRLSVILRRRASEFWSPPARRAWPFTFSICPPVYSRCASSPFFILC